MINVDKKVQILFLCLFVLKLSFYKVFGSELHKDSYLYFAGIKYVVKQNGNSSKRYILLHGDEQTAKMALESHIKDYEGIAFFIENEKREIGKTFESYLDKNNSSATALYYRNKQVNRTTKQIRYIKFEIQKK